MELLEHESQSKKKIIEGLKKELQRVNKIEM